MAGQMDGLVAWITGGGTGIGRALALEFAARGARVAVSGRRADRLDESVALIQAAGGEAQALVCDVTVEAQVEATVAAVVGHFGQLDIAVANAGYGVVGAFERISADQWRQQLDVNVIGVALSLRHALPELRHRGGRAAVVSSVLGKISLPKNAPYAASKHALVGMCNALHVELAGSGVSITDLLPGYVESEIARVDNNGVFQADRTDRRSRRNMWRAEDAAREMADAIWRRKREHVIGGQGRLAAFAGQHVPAIAYWAMRRRR